jgi:hypothetical protein
MLLNVLQIKYSNHLWDAIGDFGPRIAICSGIVFKTAPFESGECYQEDVLFCDRSMELEFDTFNAQQILSFSQS